MIRTRAILQSISVLAMAVSMAGCDLPFGWGDPGAEDIAAALRAGDYIKGGQLVAEATEDGDANADILLLSARINLDAGDGIRAEKDLREAALKQPASRVIKALLGEALARQRKPRQADAVTAQSGDKSAVAYVAGLNALFAGDDWKARESFEVAYLLDPKNDRVAIDLAYARAQLGLFDLASDLAGAVSRQMPAHLRAHKAMADIAQREHDEAGALLAFDRILNLSPADEGALMGKARTLISARRYKAADAIIAEFPAEMQNTDETRVMRGKVAARRARYEEAYNQFSLVRDVLETDDEAMFLFGVANVRRGQPWTGISLMEAALRSRPDLPEYHAGVISALKSVGDVDAAKQRIAAIPPSLRASRELAGISR
jgi:thioredoxin-like negative regulator of GroEL